MVFRKENVLYVLFFYYIYYVTLFKISVLVYRKRDRNKVKLNRNYKEENEEEIWKREQ